MRNRALTTIAALLSVGAMALAGCSSSGGGSNNSGGGLGGGATTSGGSSGGSGGGQTYKIGYEGPLSGDNAQLGINEVNAVQLAINQANAAGLPFKLDLVKADDQGLADKAPAAAAQLIQDQGVVAVIGPAFSGPTSAVGKTYSQAGLTLLSPSATNSSLTSSGFTTFFRVVPPDAVQGTQAADYLAKSHKNVFVVDDTSDYGKGLGDEIQKELTAKGVKSERQGVPANTQDYGAIAQKVASSGADALYYAGYYAGASLFAKALKAAGYKGLQMSDDGTKDPKFISGAGAAAAEGWEFSCPCLDATADPNSADFTAAYKALNNIDPGTYSPESYDCTNAIISILKQLASSGTAVTRASVLAAMKTVDYKGLTNELKFQPNGEINTQKVFLYQVKNGKIVLLGDAATLGK